MAIALVGNGGTVGEVEATTRALRITQRPNDVGALGAYRLAASSGLTTALAANGVVFALRWSASSPNVCVLRRLRVRALTVTPFTAAQELSFDAVVGRSWSVAPSGGTQLTFGGTANNRVRASMANTLVATADARIASTAVVTAGTVTVDANPFLVRAGRTLAATATSPDASIDEEYAHEPSEHPIVLAQNEGIIVRNTIALGAAGTVRWTVTAQWDELASY